MSSLLAFNSIAAARGDGLRPELARAFGCAGQEISRPDIRQNHLAAMDHDLLRHAADATTTVKAVDDVLCLAPQIFSELE